jgi:hypothetical protein
MGPRSLWPRIWARKISSVWFLGLNFVATDGAVGGAKVAWFPWLFEGLGELGAGGGVNGCGGRETFEVPESVEGLDYFLWVAEDGDEVGLSERVPGAWRVFQSGKAALIKCWRVYFRSYFATSRNVPW